MRILTWQLEGTGLYSSMYCCPCSRRRGSYLSYIKFYFGLNIRIDRKGRSTIQYDKKWNMKLSRYTFRLFTFLILFWFFITYIPYSEINFLEYPFFSIHSSNGWTNCWRNSFLVWTRPMIGRAIEGTYFFLIFFNLIHF